MENHVELIRKALSACPAYPIFDRAVSTRGKIGGWLDAAARGGVKIVQLRMKDASEKEFTSTARAFAIAARKLGVLSIINDRLDVALESGADGVHLGAEDMGIQAAREAAEGAGRIDFIIGASARTPEHAAQVQSASASYIGCGACFKTETKADAVYIGLDGLRQVAQSVRIPVAAIGGITWENYGEVLSAGAAGFAAIGMFAMAPGELARKLAEICGRPGGGIGGEKGGERA